MQNISITGTRALLTAALLLIAGTSYSQDEGATFATQNVTDNIFMLHGATGFTGGNIAVTRGVDGIAVIDNGVAGVLAPLRAEIAKITDKEIDYLINTHVHGDHTGNNEAFGSNGTRLISHRNLRASLIENGVGRGEEFVAAPAAALPVITFNDEMTLNLNGETLRLLHFENAHTDGDSVVHFLDSDVIHTGDILFNGLFPYIDSSNGGSLDGVIAALTAISQIAGADTKIIPGHGPLASKSDINKTIAMLKDAKALVVALVAKGKSDDEILAANPLQKYADYSWGFIPTERMTRQVIEAARK